jgi:DNA-binding MarR family transcriptional regulator
MLTDRLDMSNNDSEGVGHLATGLQLLVEAHRRYHLHAAMAVGLEPAEMDILLAINGTPGMTLSSLCQDVFLSPRAALGVISRLEASGQIKRSGDIPDLRGLHLTTRGSETAEILREAYRYVLSTTGASDTLSSALPCFDKITSALNATARRENTPDAF